MNRGFIFTIFSLFFFGLLLTNSLEWLSLNDSLTIQQTSIYASKEIPLILDDYAYLFSAIYPYSFKVKEKTVSFSTTLSDFNTDSFTAAQQAIEFSSQKVSDLSVSLNIESITSQQDILVDNQIILSRKVDVNNNQVMRFISPNSSTINSFDENIFVSSSDLNQTSPWSWDPSGDIAVKLTYKDSQSTVPLSGKLNSDQNHEYVFFLTNGGFVSVKIYSENEKIILETISSPTAIADVNTHVQLDSISSSNNWSFPVPYTISYHELRIDGNLNALPLFR